VYHLATNKNVAPLDPENAPPSVLYRSVLLVAQ
jgi:hypothetical protein